MSPQVEKLLSIASKSILPQVPSREAPVLKLAGKLADELYDLLLKKNGFLAFESALHVFPLGMSTSKEVIDLAVWNEFYLWRGGYGLLAQQGLFFAEDIFGCQFCIIDSVVHSFDPETGATEELADNIESWADVLLKDYEFLTGYPLAHDWQKVHGSLPLNKRLLPKIPFILGGKHSLDNLYLGDSIEGMRSRSDISRQIQVLPDGAQVRLKIQ
jgi:hypothetical protein